MAATYIQPTLEDFANVFGKIKNKHTGAPMFELVRPESSEAYYLGKVRETTAGVLCVKVLTSVAAHHNGARDCGKDAIRAVLYWVDRDGWQKGLGKERRVNRSGGQGKTAKDIVERALERARDVIKMRGSMPACSICQRPMIIRVSRDGEKAFYGCIGWKPHNEGCNGTAWNVPENEAEEAKASKRGRGKGSKAKSSQRGSQGAAKQWKRGDQVHNVMVAYNCNRAKAFQLLRDNEGFDGIYTDPEIEGMKPPGNNSSSSDRCTGNSCNEPATSTFRGKRVCEDCREGWIDGLVAARDDHQR
jgi:hypothetical protein